MLSLKVVFSTASLLIFTIFIKPKNAFVLSSHLNLREVGRTSGTTDLFERKENGNGNIRYEKYEHDGWNLGIQYKLRGKTSEENRILNVFRSAEAKKSCDYPLLLIHPVGIGLSSWFWNPFMNEWNDSDIFCPDLIGCGNVGDEWKPDERGLFFPLDWVRQLETLLSDERFLNGRPCVVITQGGLAPVGVMLASRNPDLVKYLVLCSPPTWREMTTAIDPYELKRNYDFLTSKLGSYAFRLLESRKAIQFFSDLFLFKEKADEKWLERATSECNSKVRPAIAVFNSGLLNHRSFQEELVELTQPTLMLTGDTDSRAKGRTFYSNEIKFLSDKVISGRNVLPWESLSATIDEVKAFIA